MTSKIKVPRVTKKQACRSLQFFRITDEKHNLSITNIAIIATLVAMVMRPEISTTDVGALVAALVAYQVKRFSGEAKPADESEDLKKIVADLQAKVVAIQLGSQMRK